MELAPADLTRTADVASFGFADTSEVTALEAPLAQVRAREALDFSVGMEFEGYNLYALGAPQTDKRSIILNRLKAYAAEQTPANDLCYLENFDDPGRPLYVEFPNSGGRHFKRGMQAFINSVKTMVPAAFASEEFQQTSQALTNAFQKTQSEDASQLEAQAKSMGLTMLPTPNGFVFAPVVDGKVMEQETFLTLDESERQRYQEAINTMTHQLIDRLRDYPQHAQDLIEKQRALHEETARKVIVHLLARPRSLYQGNERITQYLDNCERELLENLDKIMDADKQPQSVPFQFAQSPAAFFDRFNVNLIVDSPPAGAPVIYESNPSLENLVGKLEHRIEFGNPVTDFNQIRSGALHRANGGYLVLDAERLIQKPFAWEAIKRALSDSSVRVESVSQLLNLTYSVSLEPEAIPLKVKVVLLGSHHLYHLLREYDPDFDDLFKVVADFADHIDWTAESVAAYAALLANIVADSHTRHLDAGAVGRVLEHCSRRVEDRERLSTHISEVRDLVQEADFLARADDSNMIRREHIGEAIDKRIYRLDRFRELVRENIARGLILIETQGAKVAQVNGLSVVSIGQLTFGQPLRVTATARLGRGELIDIERESHLGGKIHSKAVMIVSSYLGSKFAKDYPLSLHASLVFEQSYGGVEGDSASVAEVCALMSAIIDRPIKQSIAITGSMDQHGMAQAIGGVNEKIEGFFEICREQGLDGSQGVIIPAANTQNLMLRDDVVKAVEAGQFHVFTMRTVDDAAAILLAEEGQPSVEIGEIHDAVIARLQEYFAIVKARPDEAGESDD